MSVDNGVYQDDPVFSNVTLENISLQLMIKGTCNPTVLTTTVLKYPKFFTPMTDSTITGTFLIWLHNPMHLFLFLTDMVSY
jgi:hypothetical protein